MPLFNRCVDDPRHLYSYFGNSAVPCCLLLHLRMFDTDRMQERVVDGKFTQLAGKSYLRRKSSEERREGQRRGKFYDGAFRRNKNRVALLVHGSVLVNIKNHEVRAQASTFSMCEDTVRDEQCLTYSLISRFQQDPGSFSNIGYTFAINS